MRISVVRPTELSASQLDRWRALQRTGEHLQDPFLSPDFACCVDRVRAGARVAVLEDGGRPAGFFSFERRALGIAKPIGFGVSDRQALVHAPGFEWDPQELLRACGLTAWDFDHLIAAQVPFAPYHRELKASPVIDLRRGYEAYLQERRRSSARLVPSTMQSARKLEREVGPLRLEPELTDGDALRTLMRWKSAQYQRTGAVDRFAVGWIVQLLEELLANPTPDCTASLAMLYAGDHAVAVHLGLRSSTSSSYWFPAYDGAYHRYSPGRYLLLRLAEAQAQMGVRYLDLGPGDEWYKRRFASTQVWLAEGGVERRSPVALLRAGSRVPRRLGERYLTGTFVEPVVKGALGALKRVRRKVG